MPATVELHSLIGSLSSPTVTLYPDGSDTAAQSGTTATAAPNRFGVYTYSNATVTGLHLIQLISGGTVRYTAWAVLATSGTIVAVDSRAEALALPNAAAGAASGLSLVGSAMALSTSERSSVADALLDRDMSTGTDSGSATVRTVRQALRFLRNKWSIAAGALTVTKEDDSTASWTGSVSQDASAEPITGNDPASS